MHHLHENFARLTFKTLCVQEAFRRLALRYHPDMRAISSSTARQRAEDQDLFVRIHSAAALLADPAQRAAYDSRRASPQFASRAAAPPRPSSCTYANGAGRPNRDTADRAYEHGAGRQPGPGKPGPGPGQTARPGENGPGRAGEGGPDAEHAAWVAEYDRLVAWFYRREPLL